MQNGQLELGQFGPLGYVFAAQRAQRRGRRLLRQRRQGDPEHYKAGDLGARRTVPIQTVADLQGQVTRARRAPAPPPATRFPRFAIRKAGMADTDVKINYAGGHPQALLALTNGKVDAAEINTQQLATADAPRARSTPRVPPDLDVRPDPERPDHGRRVDEPRSSRRPWPTRSSPRPRDIGAAGKYLDAEGPARARRPRATTSRCSTSPPPWASPSPRLIRPPTTPTAVVATLRRTSDDDQPSHRAPLAHRALSVRGLRKAFGGRTVLTGFDLDVAPGEVVALLGRQRLGQVHRAEVRRRISSAPDAGAVAGRRRRPRSTGSGRAHAAPGCGSPWCSSRSTSCSAAPCCDNVCSGALGRLPLRRSWSTARRSPAELREEAMACLDRVGLADRAHDRVGSLSGGQQQRVALARALCQRAGVLLADEPVSALDPAAAEQVMADDGRARPRPRASPSPPSCTSPSSRVGTPTASSGCATARSSSPDRVAEVDLDRSAVL